MTPEHDTHSPTQIAEWIVAARAGSAEALGRLMEYSRQYLLLIANDELPLDLQAKVGGSDLVQETQCEAVQDFAAFRGHSAAELLTWLRQILVHNVQDLNRRFAGSTKRSIRREVPLEGEDSELDVAEQLIADQSSASGELNRQDEAAVVRRAMEQLPEDYRKVIQWHHQENCSFEEIGRRLNRSADAVRKLWARAIQQLQQQVQSPHESA